MSDKLWTKDFKLLWSGKFVSSLGSFATSVALGFFVLNLTGSSTIMANVLGVNFLAFALFLPFGGVLADYLSRNKLMFFADLIRGLFLFVLAFLSFKQIVSLWFIFLTVIIIGLGKAVMAPTSDSLVSTIVKRKNIRKANGFLMLSNRFADLSGQGLGGFLFQTLGAPLLFLFDAITYVLSGISELFITDSRKTTKLKSRNILSDLKLGFSFLIKDKAAFSLVTFAGLSNMFFTLGVVVLISYFDELFSPALYGLLMAILALGVLIGSLIIGHIKKINHKFIFSLSVFLFTIFFSIGYLFNSFYLIAIFIFIGAIFNGIVNNYVGGALQLLGPVNIRARVLGSSSFFFQILRPIGTFLAGFLLIFVSAKTLIVFAYAFPTVFSLFYIFKTSLLDTIDFENKK